jgi:TatD DNase family protein
MWIDSHCHTEDPDALDRARAAGVTKFVIVGCDLASSQRAVALAARHHDVYATVGLHPHEARHLDAQWHDLAALVAEPRVVAVGEAGLDFYYEHSPKPDQDEAFRRQIEFANARDLPLVVHTREAWDDTFASLDEVGIPRRTVFHCFTGGPAEARQALDRGCSLSFSGIVSFKAADDVRAAAALVPTDRLLCETDAPYLAPVPVRGKRNEPAYLPHVGAALAAARAESIDQIAATTSANATALFGLA